MTADRPHDLRNHRLGLVASTFLAAAALVGCSSSSESSSATTTSSKPSSTAATTAVAKVRGSDGCGETPTVDGLAKARPFDVPLTFQSGGTERAYRLAIPDTYDPAKPAPLVVNLHGSGSNAVQQSVYSDLPRKAADRGYITVTPDAVNGAWQLSPTGTDDEFIDELVTAVEREYCVDLDRVHAAGISLGAWKAGLVACGHADRYAAIALVAEDVHPGDCPPMSIVAFHGTADRTVPYGEGADPGVTVTNSNAGLPGARKNLAEWAAAAGCSKDKDVTDIGTDVERWSYRGCDDGLDVDFYTIKGGGHTWPGSDIRVGDTTTTIDATELALDFFDSHPHP